MDWFLSDMEPRHERVKTLKHNVRKCSYKLYKYFSKCCKILKAPDYFGMLYIKGLKFTAK